MSGRVEKRRSSFFNGRKSLKQMADLPMFIPSGLNDEEKKNYICFEKCFARLVNEFPELDELQQFTVRAREAITAKLYEHRANAAVPNVRVNPSLEQMIDLLPKYTDKLQREEQNWNDLLQKHTNLADEAEKRLEAGLADSDIDSACLSVLSTKNREFLNNKPDYRNMLDCLTTLYNGSLEMDAELEESISTLKHFLSTENSHLMQRSYALHKLMLAEIGDPTLLRSVVEKVSKVSSMME